MNKERYNEIKNQLLDSYANPLNGKHINDMYLIYELLKDERICCVYFVQNTANNLTKIGKSENFKKRLSQLKTQIKTTLQADFILKRIIICPQSQLSTLENTLHKHYSNHRKEGEWFDIKEWSDEYDNEGTDVQILGNFPDFQIDFLWEVLKPIDIKDDFVKHINPGLFIEICANNGEKAIYLNIKSSKLIQMDEYLNESQFCLVVHDYFGYSKGNTYISLYGNPDKEHCTLADAYFLKFFNHIDEVTDQLPQIK